MNTPTPEIRKALYARLLAALPIGPVTREDVAWPNVPFVADAQRLYLAPYCLFGETEEVALSPTGFEQLRGVFQVTVFGVLNTGEAEMEQIARELTDLFRAGTRLPISGHGPLLVSRSYRSTMVVRSNASSGESTRPSIVVSASWKHFVPRGV